MMFAIQLGLVPMFSAPLWMIVWRRHLADGFVSAGSWMDVWLSSARGDLYVAFAFLYYPSSARALELLKQG